MLNLVSAQQIVRPTVWHQEGDGFEEIEISGARERAVKVRIVPEEIETPALITRPTC
jgi:hypothetical protein